MYKCHCHCSGVTESTGIDARLLICSAGSQMSDVHHRHHTFSTTYLNSPCGRLPVLTGVPRKFIPLPPEPRNLQSHSRLYRGIFLNFNPDPAGNPAGLPRDIPAPAPVQNSSLTTWQCALKRGAIFSTHSLSVFLSTFDDVCHVRGSWIDSRRVFAVGYVCLQSKLMCLLDVATAACCRLST